MQSNAGTEPTAVTQDSTDTIEYKASIYNETYTRFSTGILSCYIQALGSPQCIVVKFKTFRIKFKKVQKSSRKNKVHKSS